MSSAGKQTVAIFIGLLLGIIAGHLLHDPTWKVGMDPELHANHRWLELFDFLGSTIFMGLLKMLILPLIASTVFAAVTSVGSAKTLGRLGGYTLFYYASTMFFAVILGVILVSLIQPGIGVQVENQEQLLQEGIQAVAAVPKSSGLLGTVAQMVGMMIPQNIFASFASGQTLPVIVFFLFFGFVALVVGEEARPLVQLATIVSNILMKMVEYVLLLAPVGVFCLLAWSVARIGVGVFGSSVGMYMGTVILGLSIHAFILLPLVLWLVGICRGAQVNPFAFMGQMKRALFTAVGTDSSSATLPVTMECAAAAGISKKTAGLVLPLGATVNMDGTALYEAVAVIFLAQAYGIVLGPVELALIAVTATLAAIGAAGIPSAGLVTMVIVIDVTNQSLANMNPESALIPIGAIGLIIGVDRFLDMLRTAVNVWGDAVGAKIISLYEKEISE